MMTTPRRKRLDYANLGCGTRFHPEWINLDINPISRHVSRADLSSGIPLPDSSCDVVYHSHLIEHLRPGDARMFLAECRRVLRPGGILRVATPDLERLAQDYLAALGRTLSGDARGAADRDWMVIELIDQTVREQSGGVMLSYLSRDPLPNEAFVLDRIGEEGRHLIESLRERVLRPRRHLPRPSWHLARHTAELVLTSVQRVLVRLMTGRRGLQAFDIGRFRLSGEVHQWLYDRVSLATLLREAGFRDPAMTTPGDSRIPDWPRFHLDTLDDGTAIKPDSLFIEAVKPAEEHR